MYHCRGTYAAVQWYQEKCRLLFSEDYLKGTDEGSRRADRFAQGAPPCAPPALLTLNHGNDIVHEHKDIALTHRNAQPAPATLLHFYGRHPDPRSTRPFQIMLSDNDADRIRPLSHQAACNDYLRNSLSLITTPCHFGLTTLVFRCFQHPADHRAPCARHGRLLFLVLVLSFLAIARLHPQATTIVGWTVEHVCDPSLTCDEAPRRWWQGLVAAERTLRPKNAKRNAAYSSPKTTSKGQVTAPVGQTASHRVHHRVHRQQSSRSTKVATLSTSTRTLPGHTETHSPHPLHFPTSTVGISPLVLHIHFN